MSLMICTKSLMGNFHHNHQAVVFFHIHLKSLTWTWNAHWFIFYCWDFFFTVEISFLLLRYDIKIMFPLPIWPSVPSPTSVFLYSILHLLVLIFPIPPLSSLCKKQWAVCIFYLPIHNFVYIFSLSSLFCGVPLRFGTTWHCDLCMA